MKVYFDASVIIAALLSPTGGSSLLLTLIRQGFVTGITSQTVVDEILEEDKLPRLKHTREEIEVFIAESRLLVREVISKTAIVNYQNSIDSDDAHVIAGAHLAGCSHLVTLDKKHLLRSDIKERFLPLRIVSPKELLEELTFEE